MVSMCYETGEIQVGEGGMWYGIEISKNRKIEMYTYVHATFLEIFEHFNPHNDSHNDPSLRVGSSKFEVRRLVSPCISIDLPVTSELYTTFCTQRADREAIFCIHLPNSEKARSDCFERPQSEYKQFWDLNNLYPELDSRLLSTSNVLRSNLCFDCTNFTSKNGDYVVCYRCLVSFQGSRHRGGNIHQLMCSI